ncbi:MAG: YqgE/AlgH family protein [Rikenellaceae bacterium]|nr:YqgE/AlgH family protein [Rikenellaceae bacterium]
MFAAQVSAGTILLSEPFGTDPYFKRSVVHIVEHNDMVDIGFIINKCLTIKLTDLIEGIPDNDYTLCLGGPVQPSMLHYIHPFEGLPGSIRVKENVYWGATSGFLRNSLSQGISMAVRLNFFWVIPAGR